MTLFSGTHKQEARCDGLGLDPLDGEIALDVDCPVCVKGKSAGKKPAQGGDDKQGGGGGKSKQDGAGGGSQQGGDGGNSQQGGAGESSQKGGADGSSQQKKDWYKFGAARTYYT